MATITHRCVWCKPAHILSVITSSEITEDMTTDGMCEIAKAEWLKPITVLKTQKKEHQKK